MTLPTSNILDLVLPIKVKGAKRARYSEKAHKRELKKVEGKETSWQDVKDKRWGMVRVRERERETRAQAGGNGTLVFFKVEPSQPLDPRRCLPGLILPHPLVRSHLSELHSTPPYPSVSLSLVPLLSFTKFSPLQRTQPLRFSFFFTPLHAVLRQKREALRSFIHFLTQCRRPVL